MATALAAPRNDSVLYGLFRIVACPSDYMSDSGE
jgi:hypothetical protein